MSSNPPADDPHLPDELAQLPHGRHGLPQDFVDNNQRQRLITSFTQLVGEEGYPAATITAVHEGAGVSSRTFYKFFETVEDVCAAAFDQAAAEVGEVLLTTWGSQEAWPRRVHAALEAMLVEFAEMPDVARLLTVEPFVAGPAIARRHKAALEQLVPYLREGRELAEGHEALPDTAERGFLGAISSMVGRHILAGEAESLPELLPDLTQFLLAPYLGAGAARQFA